MWTKATGHIGTVIRPWAASTPGEEWGHRRTMGGQRISFLTKRVPTSESELSSHLKHPPLFLQCILWSISPLPLPWFPVQKRTPGQARVWIRTWPASPLEKAMTPKVNKLVDKQKGGKGQVCCRYGYFRCPHTGQVRPAPITLCSRSQNPGLTQTPEEVCAFPSCSEMPHSSRTVEGRAFADSPWTVEGRAFADSPQDSGCWFLLPIEGMSSVP